MSETVKKMSLVPLASGSGGNSSLIGDLEGNYILADCGISCRKIEKNLEKLSLSHENIKGIFITHEHTDHIAGLIMLMKKYKIPVFASKGTIVAIERCKGFDESYKKIMNPINVGKAISIDGFNVSCFNIPHDAAEPLGFSFEKYGTKISICTDLGKITDEIEENLRNSNAIVIEANHDERMLEAGRYPFHLKQRILGDRGHLSNENSGKLVAKIWNESLKYIFLGHLSDENNMPELAFETVRCELLMEHKNFEKFTKLMIANRDSMSERVIL